MSYSGDEQGGSSGLGGDTTDDPWPVISASRLCAMLAVAARVAALAPAISSVIRRRELVKRPGMAVAAAAVLVGELGWLAQRLARSDSGVIPNAGVVDAVGTLGALALSGQSGDPQVVSAFAVSLVIGSASFQAFTASLPAGLLGTAASAAVAARLSMRGKTLSTWEPMVASAGSFFLTTRLLRRVIRHNAERLERASERRAADRRRLERMRTELAVQHERDEQHRVMHQHALQVLEIVAGDWDLGPERLRAYAERESAYLRRVIAGDDMHAGGCSLAADLEDLAGEFAALGVTVRLRFDDGVVEPDVHQRVALVDAAREALTNVRKHAGVLAADVHARCDGDGGLVLSVVDEGAGFEARTSMSGLRRDVRVLMASVGGSAEIQSSPGVGTTVSLMLPGT